MTKKTILPVALAVLLLFAGCDSLNVQLEDLHGSPSSDVGAEGQQASPPAESTPAAGDADTGQEAPALGAEDFSIEVDDMTIAIGMEPAQVLDALGDGGADEDNNYGFVGWDEANQHKFFQHMYDGFMIYVMTDPSQGTSAVSQIDLTGLPTRRGIKAGDSYDDIVARYGVPAGEEPSGGSTSYIYTLGDRSLAFVMGEGDTVETIHIQ